MYLSGKPLYPIAIGVAEKFAQSFKGDIHISYSGGIDKNNILRVLKTGIAPITFSTILLKPRGYINSKDILAKIEDEQFNFEGLDVQALQELAQEAKNDPSYKNKGERGVEKEDTLPTYDCFKVNCGFVLMYAPLEPICVFMMTGLMHLIKLSTLKTGAMNAAIAIPSVPGRIHTLKGYCFCQSG